MVEFVSSDFGDDFSGRRFRGWATAAFNGRRCASSGGESGPAAVCRAVGARARWVGRVRSAGFPETIFRVGGRGVGQLRRCNGRRCASSGGESGPAAVCRAVGARARWVGRVRSAGFPETIFRVGGRGVGQLRRCNGRRCASSGGESGPAADRCGADAHTRRRVGRRLWAAAAGTHTHTHAYTRTHTHSLTHSHTHTHQSTS